MIDDLDALLDKAGQHARIVLLEMKETELLPTFLMIAAEENILMPAPWGDEIEKKVLLRAAREIMKAKGVSRYSMVSEAWTAKQPEGWKPGMPQGPLPSDRPDRKEVVIAIAADKTATKSRLWDIVRGEGGTIVDLRLDQAAQDLGGRMGELLR
jgi:hypothetical protein